jgi:hypothetical protein
MVFLGIPLFAWIGFILFLMIFFQVLTGRRIIKINIKYHRYNGYGIAAFGALKLFLWLLETGL